MHLFMPGKMRFIFHSTYKIAKHMSKAFLMRRTVGIIRAVMIMNNNTIEVFKRCLGKSVMTFMLQMLI